MTTPRFFRPFVPGGRNVSLASVLAITFGAWGCAGASRNVRADTLDVRGAASVSDHEPRILIEGPARLLHVDVDRKRDVALFTVRRHPGSPFDCVRDAVPIAAEGTVREGTSHVNRQIEADEAVCFAFEPSGDRRQQVNVSWHARAHGGTTRVASEFQLAKQP
ncbi:MAG: hypothetical protein ABJA82_02665 [Myxococcales bacterium]